jgi:hypothetical protein
VGNATKATAGRQTEKPTRHATATAPGNATKATAGRQTEKPTIRHTSSHDTYSVSVDWVQTDHGGQIATTTTWWLVMFVLLHVRGNAWECI